MSSNRLPEKISWSKRCIGVSVISKVNGPLLDISLRLGAHLYAKNPELIERDMQRIADVNPQHRQSNGGYELIYDVKRPIRQTPSSHAKSPQDEYRRPGSLKEMKADLTRALHTILSEDILDLGIR